MLVLRACLCSALFEFEIKENDNKNTCCGITLNFFSLCFSTNINGVKSSTFVSNEEEEQEQHHEEEGKEIESRLTHIYNENDKHIETALWISLLNFELFNYTRACLSSSTIFLREPINNLVLHVFGNFVRIEKT